MTRFDDWIMGTLKKWFPITATLTAPDVQLRELKKEQRLIDAIKLARMKYGFDLIEAKRHVEGL